MQLPRRSPGRSCPRFKYSATPEIQDEINPRIKGSSLRFRYSATAGLGRGWIDGDVGHGRAYRFDIPEGHAMELLWDVECVTASAGQETPLRSRPRKHQNLMAANTGAVRDFMVDILGFRERERIVSDGNGSVLVSWLSVTNLSHNIAIVPESTDMRGRLHQAAPIRCGGTGEGSRHQNRTWTWPPWRRRGNGCLHAGAGGQSLRGHRRSRLHDFRSCLGRPWSGRDRSSMWALPGPLADAGLFLELRERL
jgi:hypothetical protein